MQWETGARFGRFQYYERTNDPPKEGENMRKPWWAAERSASPDHFKDTQGVLSYNFPDLFVGISVFN